MLYIVLENSSGKTINAYEWHIGTKFPVTKGHMDLVSEIQADDHELVHILHLFGTSIPRCENLVQYWFGDIAKTIASAL